MLWFDTIIFLLTLYKAVLMRRELSGGLLEVLFRDGTSFVLTYGRYAEFTAIGTIYYGYVRGARVTCGTWLIRQ